jgi:hypothetical protein
MLLYDVRVALPWKRLQTVTRDSSSCIRIFKKASIYETVVLLIDDKFGEYTVKKVSNLPVPSRDVTH